MSFFKRRGKAILSIAFPLYLIVQSLAMSYGRSVQSQAARRDEIEQLRGVWNKAVKQFKIANHTELESAQARLKEAATEIQNFQKRVDVGTGEKSALFEQVHAFYHDKALALLSIVDFLLAHEGEYSVEGDEIHFFNEVDGEKLNHLINQWNNKKKHLGALITQYEG